MTDGMTHLQECYSCRGFAAEINITIDNHTHQFCYICAHVFVVHGASIDTAMGAIDRCTCTEADVYPPEVVSRRRALLGSEKINDVRSQFVGRNSARWADLKARLAPHTSAIADVTHTPQTKGVPARERQARARIAAAKTAASRRANALASRP